MKDFTGRFDWYHKMDLINILQKRGVLGRELQPVSFDWRNVAYWHWEVLEPENLPDYLWAEFELYGEIRL